MNTVYKVIYPALAIVVLILISFVLYSVFSTKQKDQNESIEKTEETENSELQTPTKPENDELANAPRITDAEIAAGNSFDTKCLTVINSQVFEIPKAWAEVRDDYAMFKTVCGANASLVMNSPKYLNDPTTLLELSNFFIGVVERY